MKKALLLISSMLVGLSCLAAQTQKDHFIGERTIIVVDDFSSALSPAISIPQMANRGGYLTGFSVAFDTSVTSTVTLGYIRNGVTNTVYSEAGTGTTFSWEGGDATGGWVLMPDDTIVVTSTDSTDAQITIILDW